ncbi:hypothetical protein V6Z11_D04G049000 [Gossypium hirsutum]
MKEALDNQLRVHIWISETELLPGDIFVIISI